MGRGVDIRRRRRQASVEALLGNLVICSTCGATLLTFGDVCSAPLDVACEGFVAIDRAKVAVAKGATS